MLDEHTSGVTEAHGENLVRAGANKNPDSTISRYAPQITKGHKTTM